MIANNPSILRSGEHAPALLVAPLLAILDHGDFAMRVRNYRRSCKACPAGWQTYFEVLIAETERQLPQ